MENLEDIKKLYELTEEEKNKAFKIIYDKYTYGKGSTDRPFAVIVIGQPGAGKSGLMGYTENQFETAISLDIDDLRAYFPRYDEVANEHPEAFEAITGAFATSMIHMLTPVLIEEKHNLILHKTRGDDAVIYDTILPLQKSGYDFILRVLAVNHLESKMSALERSLAQREKFNVCRWVRKDYHQKQYDGIPELADLIEKKKLADIIEVYTRGEVPVLPHLKYSTVVDDKILSNSNMVSKNGEMMIGEYNPNRYTSSKDAIHKAREIDVPKILDTINDRIKLAKQKAVVGDEKEYIDEVEEIAANYKAKING